MQGRQSPLIQECGSMLKAILSDLHLHVKHAKSCPSRDSVASRLVKTSRPRAAARYSAACTSRGLHREDPVLLLFHVG